MLRRIIRRAVRHAYLLGARRLVTPALVDATVEVDGRRLPRARRSTTTLVARAWSARGGAVPPDARSAALDLLDERARRRATSPASDAFFLHDTLGFPIDLTREIAAERGRAVDLDGFEPRMARAAHARPRGAQGRRAARRRRAGRALPRAPRRVGPTEFTGRQEYDDRRRQGASALVARRRAARAGRRRRRRSTSCSTARRSTPSRAARSATPARSRPTDGAGVDVADTQYGAARRAGRAPRRGRAGRRSPRATRSSPRSTARAATASAATTPRPTSCTGRCARCSART